MNLNVFLTNVRMRVKAHPAMQRVDAETHDRAFAVVHEELCWLWNDAIDEVAEIEAIEAGVEAVVDTLYAAIVVS